MSGRGTNPHVQRIRATPMLQEKKAQAVMRKAFPPPADSLPL